MKITVWEFCRVRAEIDLPDAPGPDIGIDPWNGLLGPSGEMPRTYGADVLAAIEALPERDATKSRDFGRGYAHAIRRVLEVLRG